MGFRHSNQNLPDGAVEYETTIDYFGRNVHCRYWAVTGEVVRAEVSFKRLNGTWKTVNITEQMDECFWLDEALHDDLANNRGDK